MRTAKNNNNQTNKDGSNNATAEGGSRHRTEGLIAVMPNIDFKFSIL
jgi:hypothetical protein